MNRAYRIALFCGACPLIVGISIFLLWFVTRWDWLMAAGIYTLYGGVVAFFIGADALGRYVLLACRTPEIPRRRMRRATLGCAGLLLSNFVAAGAIIVSVISIEGLMGEKQTQQIARVTEVQKLTFHASGARHPSSVTLRVHGHIEGSAMIKGPLNALKPQTISDDVDWQIYGDYYVPDIEFEYVPANVTAGQLTFKVTFH